MTLVHSSRSDVRRDGSVVTVRLSGDWGVRDGVPAVGDVEVALSDPTPATKIVYEAGDLGRWDSALLAYLLRVSAAARGRGVLEDRDGLPQGVRGLIRLAEAVPKKDVASEASSATPFVVRVGLSTIQATRGFETMLAFIGEVAMALLRWIRGKARYRRSDLLLAVQRAGIEAMPIVALVNFLMGVILAFVGAIQLQQFGAGIYVANLVGVGMVRDIAALMTGIVMSGRSGAAYAAEIGSMQVNEEIDALTTAGMSPIDFLVLPRLLALVFMMPLLVIYADFVSMLGGMLVAVTMLEQSFTAYVLQSVGAVNLSHVIAGMVKATTYGAIVAMAGCLRGLQSGRSSLDVGAAATSAVVTAIVLIIAAAGVFAMVSYILGI